MSKYRYYTTRFIHTALEASRAEAETLRQGSGASLVLGIVYAVGVLGLWFNIHPQFIYLTPINLLLSLGLVLYAHRGWTLGLGLALLLCFGMGLGVEMLGVTTGEVFGEYAYGEVLGPKIHGTPWMIGVNWMMLIYCAAAVTNQLLSRPASVWVKAFLGSLLMVSLDLLIEPVAIILGFWHWGNGMPPLQNYLAWGGVSFVLLLLFHLLAPAVKNKVAFTLFILQFLFFFLLGIAW